MDKMKKALNRIWFAQGGMCFFCKQALPRSIASLEHLQAQSYGGDNSYDNCVVCCKTLNGLFGNLTLREKFQIVLSQKGEFFCPRQMEADEADNIHAETTISANFSEYVSEIRDAALEILRNQAHARPRTLKSLTNMVTTLFKRGVSEEALSAVMAQIGASGSVLIKDGIVSYAFDASEADANAQEEKI